jgi:hypothetical protein
METAMKKYPGVRYRDGAPLNDLERIMHNDKSEAEFIRSTLVELKDMVLEIKLELHEMRKHCKVRP